MTQLGIVFAQPRRIDLTIERVNEIIEGMSEVDKAALGNDPRWPLITTVAALRSYERAEENACGHCIGSIADAYDQLIKPGENAFEALLRTFAAVYGREHNEMPERAS
jgi:hypothetical protein